MAAHFSAASSRCITYWAHRQLIILCTEKYQPHLNNGKESFLYQSYFCGVNWKPIYHLSL